MRKIAYALGVLTIGFGLIRFFIASVQPTYQKHQEDFEKGYNVFSLERPQELYFAGERVPTENDEVWERLDREMLVNTYWQSNALLFIKRSNRWFPIIEPILKENGVPDDFKYLALIESGFMHVVSPAGAAGYWQFIERTAKEYDLEVNNYVDERYNVYKATTAACEYLKDAYNSLGSWTKAAAAYNMGTGGVRNQLKKQQVESYYDLYLNSETSRYVFRILAAKMILSNPKSYGFNVLSEHLYKPFKTKIIEVDTTYIDLVEFANMHQVTYKTLKRYNPWLRSSILRNPYKKTYQIEIPLEPEITEPIPEKEVGIDSLKLDVDTVKNEQLNLNDSLIIHKVKKKESIEDIVNKYNVNISDILEWNNLREYYLKPGQELKIYLKRESESK
jgi:membrane-bound lytic murein transglycosylase D